MSRQRTTTADVRAAARSLGLLLEEVTAGRITATPRMLSHLRGSRDALALLVADGAAVVHSDASR